MPKIIPAEAFKHTSDIFELCRESDAPVFITKNGHGDMVLMSIEMYERLTGEQGVAPTAVATVTEAADASAVAASTESDEHDEILSFFESIDKYGL